MNRYEVTVFENGLLRAILVTSTDPIQAIYASGVSSYSSVTKVELIGTTNIEDYE